VGSDAATAAREGALACAENVFLCIAKATELFASAYVPSTEQRPLVGRELAAQVRCGLPARYRRPWWATNRELADLNGGARSAAQRCRPAVCTRRLGRRSRIRSDVLRKVVGVIESYSLCVRYVVVRCALLLLCAGCEPLCPDRSDYVRTARLVGESELLGAVLCMRV